MKLRLIILALLALPFAPACEQAPPDVTAVEFIFGGPGLGRAEFSYPRSIAVSPVDGRVFVVDKSPVARIQRFSPDGDYEAEWHMPEAKVGKPTGLYVDRQNRVWVPDTHYHRVICFDRDGRERLRFGRQGRGPGEFLLPTDVILDRDGNIYVAEYGGNDRISKFSPDLDYLFSFADESSGDAWVDRPAQMAFDNEQTLWVVDACHHRLCRFDRDGNLLHAFGSAGSGDGRFNYPYGLTIEPAGTILVADRGNNRIVRVSPDGRFLETWGSQGRGVGQVYQPWGVAAGLDGRIYCLDSYNNRVQVIDW